uniref:Major facilitator superfamily (MFS) profile domain-containing protein n=1 Tax=Oryza rufipogon TaxID=4529 RepID=A0A0E0Q3P0_ORYRU
MASAAAPEIQELIHHPYDGRVTSFVVLTCVTACLGGIIFGYDIGVSGNHPPTHHSPSLPPTHHRRRARHERRDTIGGAGGVTSMDAFLERFFPEVYRRMHGGGERVSNYCRFDSQLLTAFTSSLYVSGLATTFLASHVTARRGRRASMLVAGAAIAAGATVGASAAGLATVILGRVLLGVGVGFGNQAVPLYLSEMAPPSRRGAFSNGFQLCISVGAFVAERPARRGPRQGAR